MRGATQRRRAEPRPPRFQSAHPLRGATIYACSKSAAECISIRAPLAGCDRWRRSGWAAARNFNPRTPCGVRPLSAHRIRSYGHFNPRTPCGVRRARLYHPHPLWLDFNPRTPCGVRGYLGGRGGVPWYFNPRTPCGVRHAVTVASCAVRDISIRAPLAGCDVENLVRKSTAYHFNPRTPCGVRRAACSVPPRRRRFQSAHPLRGATRSAAALHRLAKISIRAPLAGCDPLGCIKYRLQCHFNPRTPCGVRLSVANAIADALIISIRAPHAGCDDVEGTHGKPRRISIRAPHAGCDRRLARQYSVPWYFNPRTPCGVRRKKRAN